MIRLFGARRLLPLCRGARSYDLEALQDLIKDANAELRVEFEDKLRSYAGPREKSSKTNSRPSPRRPSSTRKVSARSELDSGQWHPPHQTGPASKTSLQLSPSYWINTNATRDPSPRSTRWKSSCKTVRWIKVHCHAPQHQGRRLETQGGPELNDAALWMQAKNAKILFGEAGDTTLQRSNVQELSTGHDFVVNRDSRLRAKRHLTL